MARPNFNNEPSRFDLSGDRPPLATRPSPSEPEKNRKPLFIGIGTGLAALAVVGGLVLANPFGSDSTPTAPPVDKAPTGSSAPATEAWYEADDVPLPVEVPEWTEEYQHLTPKSFSPETLEEAYEAYDDSRLLAAAKTVMRSEATGMTSNPAMATDEYGLPNPDYSFITEEIFVQQTYAISQKFLNPSFGGWARYQHDEANARTKFDPKGMTDVLAPSYLKEVRAAKDKSFFPVFADWKSNNYGMDNLVPTGTRWVGTVNDYDVKFKYDKKVLNYEATITYDVTYTAWTENRQTVDRDAVLKLHFVVNPAAAQVPDLMRLHVDGGSLELK